MISPMHLLQIHGLRWRWPKDPVRELLLDELSLVAGQWTALVGANGTGKSTLMRALADPAQTRHVGTGILLEGRPLGHWSASERARKLSWLPQATDSFEGSLSVEHTAMLGRAPWLGLVGAPTPRDQRAVEQALDAMELQSVRHRPLSQLSGGERQRALIARVLATEASVMLMDEPLAALDQTHQQALLRVIRNRCVQGASALVIVHDLNIALQADAVMLLTAGRALPARSPSDPSLQRDLQEACEGAIEVLAHPRQPGAWIALPRAY